MASKGQLPFSLFFLEKMQSADEFKSKTRVIEISQVNPIEVPYKNISAFNVNTFIK